MARRYKATIVIEKYLTLILDADSKKDAQLRIEDYVTGDDSYKKNVGCIVEDEGYFVIKLESYKE